MLNKENGESCPGCVVVSFVFVDMFNQRGHEDKYPDFSPRAVIFPEGEYIARNIPLMFIL